MSFEAEAPLIQLNLALSEAKTRFNLNCSAGGRSTLLRNPLAEGLDQRPGLGIFHEHSFGSQVIRVYPSKRVYFGDSSESKSGQAVEGNPGRAGGSRQALETPDKEAP